MALTAVAAPAMAVTCPEGSKRAGEDLSDLALCNTVKTDESENNLMKRLQAIVNVVLGVIGFVAVVYIVIGGVQYATSAGDTGKITKAKNTIMYAVIGLVVALLAFAIVNFVLDNVMQNP